MHDHVRGKAPVKATHEDAHVGNVVGLQRAHEVEGVPPLVEGYIGRGRNPAHRRTLESHVHHHDTQWKDLEIRRVEQPHARQLCRELFQGIA